LRGNKLYISLCLLTLVMFFGTAICSGFSSGDEREPSPPEYLPEAGRMTVASGGSLDSPRIILERILARKEFRDVHRPPEPTAWERLKLRISEFLVRVLGKIFGSSAFPEISKIIIWVLAGVALVVLAVWIYKTLKQSSRLESVNLSKDAPVSARPWPTTRF
jgi:hypothetical protein